MALMYSLDLISPHTSGMAKYLKRSGKKTVVMSKSWITYNYVEGIGETEGYWVKTTHFKDDIHLRKGNKIIAYAHQYANSEIVEGEGA